MSLIINMLKDLDKRDKRTTTLPPVSYKRASFSRYLRLSTPFTLFISIIAFITLFLISTYIYFKNTHLNHVAHLLPPVTTTTPLNEVNNSLANYTAKINGITIQPSDKSTIMLFNIDHPFFYRLASNNDHLFITFENAALQSSLPKYEMDNMLVESINSRIVNNDIQFDIKLKSGWKIESATNENANGHYNFKLNLAGKINKNNLNTSIESTIKKPVLSDEINQRYQNALTTAQAGDKTKAIAMLSSILKTTADHHLTRTALVALLIETGKYDNAETVLNKGTSLAPAYIPYIELKARLLSIKNDTNGAILLLQNSAPDINEYPDYHAFLAALYQQANKYSLAADIYRQLVQIEPTNGSWWFGLALSMDKVGNKKEAVYAYSNAMRKGQLTTASLNYLHKRLNILQEGKNETY